MADVVADVAAATWAVLGYNQSTMKFMRNICRRLADGETLTRAEAAELVAGLDALLESGGTILETVELFLNGSDSDSG